MGEKTDLSVEATVWENIAWPGIVHLATQISGGPTDLTDTLRVPRELGLGSDTEEQQGDLFQRALIVDVLTDCAELLGDQAKPLIEGELDYLLNRRRGDGRGWNYFPDLPEFPPDADTLSCITIALSQAGLRADVEKYCIPALEFALDHCVGPNGVVRTWLVPDFERTADGRLPEPWTNCLWEDSGDADVFPSLLFALHLSDPDRFAGPIARGIDHLEQVQRHDGGWASPFYCGRFYAIYAGLRLLSAVRPDSPAVLSAVNLLRATQHPDGGWGRRSAGSDPQSTALALLALATVPDLLNSEDLERSARAADYLAGSRGVDRLWPAGSLYWILDEVGKPPTMTPFASSTLTAAFVVKASSAWRRIDTRPFL
ncbi:prenyltransferase/squalene oxidase repeat-containing protein [Nocardia sp. NPDC058114]|uniref:prenyltransferase/squalene oxidase repeat-containing protein n=1 Tax=Nocardia sp. NPDC058114 TaxID=3346346 RepID=UPI0036DBEB9E